MSTGVNWHLPGDPGNPPAPEGRCGAKHLGRVKDHPRPPVKDQVRLATAGSGLGTARHGRVVTDVRLRLMVDIGFT